MQHRGEMSFWGNTASAVLLLATVLLPPSTAGADARSDHLIGMLKNGATYRIRVQAATSLGSIRCTEAVEPLRAALEDESDLVIIAAAAALAQIGDVASIPFLESALKKTPSPAARTQLEISIRVLKSLGHGDVMPTPTLAAPRFLIRVDAMGNSSGAGRTDLSELMKRLVVERLEKEPGVSIQNSQMRSDQVNAAVRKQGVLAFILSGSIVKMEKQSSRIVVKLSLNVFSNPEYSLLAMPSAEGSVSFADDATDPDTERKAQDRALKTVVDGLVGTVLRSLDGLGGRAQPAKDARKGN